MAQEKPRVQMNSSLHPSWPVRHRVSGRSQLGTITLLCAVLLMAGIAFGAARPNVVLIVCDDLNTSIGHLGDPQALTPHIDRLAATGVSFRRAYSNNPVCAPSRASFLTGILPSTSGNLFWAPWFKNPVLRNSRTLMEHFRANGYQVEGSGKLMHHHRESDWDAYPLTADYGPTPVFDGKRGVHPSVPAPFNKNGSVDGSFGPLVDLKDTGEWQYGGWAKGSPMRYRSDDDRDPTPDEKVAAWAAGRLMEFAQDKSEKPFFLGVGFIRPHTPLHAPQRYFDRFPLDTIKLPPLPEDDWKDTHFHEVFTGGVKGLRYYRTLLESFPDRDTALTKYRQAYLACVAAADDCIGTVLDALEQSGLAHNTVVVFTSDHGWHNGEKNFLFKNSPWEEATRVPFVVRAPGVSQRGKIAEHPISLIDLYPTLVDLCGLEGDTVKNPRGKPLDGHSVRPFLEDPSFRAWTGPEFALSMVHADENAQHQMSKDDYDNAAKQHWTLRTEQYRYIRYNNGAEELYDHSADPNEWRNLVTDPGQLATLERFRSLLRRTIPGIPSAE
ncbi:MAG: Choline-sulfatase [Planctomycetota bacterium]